VSHMAGAMPWGSDGPSFWQDLWRTRTYRLFPAMLIYVACASLLHRCPPGLGPALCVAAQLPCCPRAGMAMLRARYSVLGPRLGIASC